MFCVDDIRKKRYGQGGGKIYDDIQDTNEIISVIKGNPGRAVDNLILSQDPAKVKTALIVGPLIYGQGQGPVNTRSVQVEEIARVTLETRHPFRLGAGLSTWSNIHVQDVASLVGLLTEAAIAHKTGLWNEDGIYLPENGKMVSCRIISP